MLFLRGLLYLGMLSPVKVDDVRARAFLSIGSVLCMRACTCIRSRVCLLGLCRFMKTDDCVKKYSPGESNYNDNAAVVPLSKH